MGGIAEASREALWVSLQIGGPLLVLLLVVGLVVAVGRAELTLQTAVAVRDRVVAAYQEVMRMPI